MSVLHDQRREPPRLGDGKPWPMRCLKFIEAERETMFMVGAGMAVHPDLHEFYFGARKNAERSLAERDRLGIAAPMAVVSLNDDGMPTGAVLMDESDGADELAFVACALIEWGHKKTGFIAAAPLTNEQVRRSGDEFKILATAMKGGES